MNPSGDPLPSISVVVVAYGPWTWIRLGILLSLLTLVGLARGEHVSDMAHASATSWWGWLYLVTFGSLLAFTAFVWVTGHAPLSLVATYAYVNPVVAVLLGWWILGEQVSIGLLVGLLASVVASGVLIAVPEIMFPNSAINGLDRFLPIVVFAVVMTDIALAALAYRFDVASAVRARAVPPR